MIWLLIGLVIKNLIVIVAELFIRGRKLNTSLVFITQSYFSVRKNIRVNTTQCFIIKIPNKQEIWQNKFNHWSNIEFKYFMNLYKKCTEKPYSVLVIDATFASDNSSDFRKRYLKKM